MLLSRASIKRTKRRARLLYNFTIESFMVVPCFQIQYLVPVVSSEAGYGNVKSRHKTSLGQLLQLLSDCDVSVLWRFCGIIVVLQTMNFIL